MVSPPLYIVRKFPLKFIMSHDFVFDLNSDQEKMFQVKQSDNMLFRQIRLITGDSSKYNKWIVFIDIKGGKSYEDQITELVLNGIVINGRKFVICERSASMTRVGILSFIDASIAGQLDERVSMGLSIGKTVLSKWYAYRGLMLSSCHCIENWYPKIVVVPDYFRTIPNQHIKYVYEKEVEFTDKDGNNRVWKQKDIDDGYRNIEINAFDGCGIHHPSITKYVKEKLHASSSPTSILWRLPFIKGVTHEMDYTRFFQEREVTSITDIWGVRHDIDEPMIIICESMYKGYKYFKQNGDYRDWDDYWRRFKEYNHCIGVAKYNFTTREEPVYTRGNYQIFQDLDLSYDRFALLAKDSVDWITKIIQGDLVYTMCFLGLYADSINPSNDYVRAILKNQEMLKESGVRFYLVSLLKKYINDMKCGKLYIKSCFKFLAPDLIMLMEHIGGLPPVGILEENQFFSIGRTGVLSGKYLIERNPHICKSEHTVLYATGNQTLMKYCSHLENVCMVNCRSITPQRLNGADHDGDLVLVTDNQIMMEGVHVDSPIVIDVDDKVTVAAEEDNIENKLKIIFRTMHSLIGETSNCATVYHNKTPKSIEQKKKYESYIDLLSVINGKAVDFAKTGVIYNIPRNIAKFGRPLPYFMKYRSLYYSKLKKLSKSYSNMNRLCWEIEKWERNIKWSSDKGDFDYTIMIDKDIPVDDNKLSQIESIYREFSKDMMQLKKDQKSIQDEIGEFIINWQYYYDIYYRKCADICPSQKELANLAVIICYEKYPGRSKNFMWRVASKGIIENLKQKNISLPIEDSDGDYVYLGRNYRLEDVQFDQ